MLAATGGTGQYAWSVVDGTVPPGLNVDESGRVSGNPLAAGTFSFSVRASDVGSPGNVAVGTVSVVIRALEVVLYASDARIVSGTWSLVADPSAAGGFRLWNPDKGVAKLATALTSPVNYFEITFRAEADVPYHLWVRGRADANFWGNDSVMVQFSGSVDATGAPKYRIGTTSANDVNLENCSGCGISGWGWQDNAWGLNVFGAPIYFERSGTQTVRVQVKEDGFSIDQIVLSADKYFNVAPGALKNDTTIVPR
jgi:hypothetical protein